MFAEGAVFVGGEYWFVKMELSFVVIPGNAQLLIVSALLSVRHKTKVHNTKVL